MPGCIDLPGEFLSTPSGWRATSSQRACPRSKRQISIHALRVEGDRVHALAAWAKNISIHALRVEGDLFIRIDAGIISRFLSTPSGWRATLQNTAPPRSQLCISIHALRVEGD